MIQRKLRQAPPTDQPTSGTPIKLAEGAALFPTLADRDAMVKNSLYSDMNLIAFPAEDYRNKGDRSHSRLAAPIRRLDVNAGKFQPIRQWIEIFFAKQNREIDIITFNQGVLECYST